MARANRHFIPGYVWHITHRCHKQEFLLRFAKDRQRWLHWLYEARKRYGLCVLNYTVTSNHIHLLVFDRGNDAIARSMQLIAGRTAQEFNQRKKRKGAFWEDRYHATAIDTGEYLARCITYIDLNMVRNGVLGHPSMWQFGGYCEIQNPPNRYRIIDMEKLVDLVGSNTVKQLQLEHRGWIESALDQHRDCREPCWTEGIAVGSEQYIIKTKALLDERASGRHECYEQGQYVLKESHTAYSPVFDAKKGLLSGDIGLVAGEE
jgi:REP element-mobilizing transposase RayT